MNPIFSIIIATFNCEITLRRCLESLFSQSEKSFELLVVDGDSKDQTMSILREYKERFTDRFVFLLSEKDTGVYSAWNKALPHIKGQWVYFMGADDFLWDYNSLSAAKEKLNALPATTRLAYGKIAIVTQKTEEVLYYEGEPWSHYKWRYMHEMVLPHQATFHKNELFQNKNYFNEEFQVCGDVELIMREIVQNRMPVFLGNDLLFAAMRVGGISSDYKNVEKIIFELKKIRKLNKLGFSYRIFLREWRFKVRAWVRLLFGETITFYMVDFYRFICGKKGFGIKNKKNAQ